VADTEDKITPERLLVPDLGPPKRRKRYPNAWPALRKNLPETEDGKGRDTDRYLLPVSIRLLFLTPYLFSFPFSAFSFLQAQLGCFLGFLYSSALLLHDTLLSFRFS